MIHFFGFSFFGRGRKEEINEKSVSSVCSGLIYLSRLPREKMSAMRDFESFCSTKTGVYWSWVGDQGLGVRGANASACVHTVASSTMNGFGLCSDSEDSASQGRKLTEASYE